MTEAQTATVNGPISNIPQDTPVLLNLDEMEPMKISDSVEHLDPAKVVLDEAYNPRRYQVGAARILDMAQKIVQNGQIYPILARKINGKVFVIDGATRVRAILHINEQKLTDKPLKVAAAFVDMEDAQSYLTAVSANVDRNEMTPIDHANVIKVLMGEYGMKNKDVSKALRKSPSWVTEHAQLGELRPAIQKKIHEGKVPYRSALQLLGKTDEEQDELVTDIESGATRDVLKKRSKAKGIKTKKGKKAGKTVTDITLTLKELRKEYEALAGLDLEEGQECKFDEQIQGLGMLLIKHMDSKIGIQALVNQIEKLYA